MCKLPSTAQALLTCIICLHWMRHLLNKAAVEQRETSAHRVFLYVYLNRLFCRRLQSQARASAEPPAKALCTTVSSSRVGRKGECKSSRGSCLALGKGKVVHCLQAGAAWHNIRLASGRPTRSGRLSLCGQAHKWLMGKHNIIAPTTSARCKSFFSFSKALVARIAIIGDTGDRRQNYHPCQG